MLSLHEVAAEAKLKNRISSPDAQVRGIRLESGTVAPL